MKGFVSLRGEHLEQFEIGNWVKQGCVLVSTLFMIFLFMVLFDAFNDSTQKHRYRVDRE